MNVQENLTLRAGEMESLPVKVYPVLQGGTLLASDDKAQKALRQAENCEGFGGALGEISCVWDYEQGSAEVLLGLGKEANTEALRRATAQLLHWAEGKKLSSLGLCAEGLTKAQQQAAAEGAVMAAYRYDAFLTKKGSQTVKELILAGGEAAAVAEGAVLGAAVNIARDLVNEPSNVQTPKRLAEEAMALGQRFGLEVQCFEGEELQTLGMEALQQVAKGSPNPPVLIVLRYKGDPAHPENITGFIGKGVTFDSGGLNLKSGARFATMKHDMAGSATVLGALCAIAQEQLPINVTAVVAACENLLSGQAYKPGDIIGSMAGKSIQINNTDAEGRLTLIDALTYAIRREGAQRLVDIATLTGAARRVLGDYGALALGSDDALWEALAAAAGRADELICRIPLVEEMRSSIQGDVADLVNTNLEATGGTVSAALFLEEFTEGLPWLHIDAAGPLWRDRPLPYAPKGGSGWGVRTLYQLAKELSE